MTTFPASFLMQQVLQATHQLSLMVPQERVLDVYQFPQHQQTMHHRKISPPISYYTTGFNLLQLPLHNTISSVQFIQAPEAVSKTPWRLFDTVPKLALNS